MDSLFSQVLDQVNIGTIVVDQNLNVIIWNSWLEQFTGITKEQAQGQRIQQVCPRFGERVFYEILQNALFSGQRRFCSGALHKAFVMLDNSMHYDLIRQNMQISPVHNNYALIQIFDVTGHLNRVHQLKNVIKALEVENHHIKVSERTSKHQALHDPLTKLPNRILLGEQLSLLISSAQRNGQLLALLFLDLDEFKSVNDNFGHTYGDELLRNAAKRLHSYIRKSDLLARIGGDEFIIVLSQIMTKEDASRIAQKVNHAFEQPFKIYDQVVLSTLSIGISLYPKDGLDANDLIHKADLAMYQRKKSGKNSFHFFENRLQN